MSIADLFQNIGDGVQNAAQGFGQAFQPPADPNAINPQYGMSEGDVQAAKMANLQQMSRTLIAASQSMPGSDRAQILAQMPSTNDISKQLYTMAQARLMNTQAQDANIKLQRQQQAIQAMQSPDFQAQLGNQLGDREKAIFGAYMTAGDPAGALDYLKTNDMMRARFGGGMSGLPGGSVGPDGMPLTGDALLGQMTPEAAGVIKGIANYDLDPTKVAGTQNGARQRLLSAVMQYDPTYDMSQYGARAAMRKSVTSGNYSQSINAANLVIQHLDALQQAADSLNNTNMPLVNSAKNQYLAQTGDPRIKAFQTAADAASAELAKVFKGVGATSEQEINSWRSTLSPNASPDQIKAAIQMATSNLLASRLDTIRTQYQSVMGKPGDFTMLTPHSRAVLQKMGVDPTQIDVGGGGLAGSAPAAAGGPSIDDLVNKYRTKQ